MRNPKRPIEIKLRTNVKFYGKIPHYFHTFHTTVFRAKTIFSLCINDLRNHTKSWHADCDIISEPAKEWRHNEAAQQNN